MHTEDGFQFIIVAKDLWNNIVFLEKRPLGACISFFLITSNRTDHFSGDTFPLISDSYVNPYTIGVLLAVHSIPSFLSIDHLRVIT